MTCINVREGDGIVSVINLDGCGGPDTGPAGLLRLSNISEISFEDNVSEGDEVVEKNFGGRRCYSDTGQDEITNTGLTVTSCGINPALDSALVGSTMKSALGKVRGFGRTDLTTNNVAIEVLMQLDADACDGSGAAPVAGWVFPLARNWRPAQATTLNGTDLVKPQYTGKGYKNPRIFGGASPEVVATMSKWQNILVVDNAVDRMNEWYAFFIFDGDDIVLPSSSCEPVALALAT